MVSVFVSENGQVVCEHICCAVYTLLDRNMRR